MDVPASPSLTAANRVRCVAGAALGLGVSVAPAFLSPFSVLAKPMSGEFGWSRAALFIAVTIFSAGGVLMTPIAGRLVDRIGARTIALTGALLLPVAVASFALLPPDYRLFVAAAVFVALVGGASQPTVYLSVIVRRFDHSVGIALAIALAGLGLGQALASILAQSLLEHFGWRGAWLGIAAVVGGLGLLAFATVPWRSLPAVMRPADGTEVAAVWPTLMRSPLFWILTIALLLILMVSAGTALNLVAALQDRGFGALAAASVAAAIPLAAIAGRLLTGALVDRLPYIAIGVTLFAAQALGCWLLAAPPSDAAIYAAVVLIGLGYGAESDLLPYVIKRRFGTRFFGSIFGLMFGLIQIGVMAGPLFAARVFDSTGSYRGAFETFTAASAIAAALWLLSQRLRAPPTSSAWVGERPPGAVGSRTVRR